MTITIYNDIYKNMTDKDVLIEKLNVFRLDNRISQEKLADMLGVSFVTINRWLNGHQKPNTIQTYHIDKLLKSAKKGRKK